DRAEWFVQQEHTWFRRQGAGNCDPLSLSARKLMRIALLKTFQSQQSQQLFDARFDFSGAPFFYLQAEGDIFEDVHVLEQCIVLEHKPDVALLNFDVIDAFAANENVAIGWGFQAGDHSQHGGLSATARPQQRHQFAVTHREADLVDGWNIAEVFADILEFDAHRQR